MHGFLPLKESPNCSRSRFTKLGAIASPLCELIEHFGRQPTIFTGVVWLAYTRSTAARLGPYMPITRFRNVRLSALLLILPVFGNTAVAQTCTGLCLQQISCPSNGTTSISGTVYAPNGVDPLPNVTVYIPNATVGALPTGVACPVPGQAPPGAPLVGTYTAPDGTFKISNVPVGNNIPIVIVAGKWRRQLTVPGTSACANTTFDARFPKNQSEGDIPKIAISTGSADAVECVFRKIGVDDAEFTNAGGKGRINLFLANDAPGAQIDAGTSKVTAVLGDQTVLNSYDVLMLPCEGRPNSEPQIQLTNLVSYANAGGRVYGSHFAYEWMYNNPPFDKVANWYGSSVSTPLNGPATVNPNFTGGATLTTWLQVVHASTAPGQISLTSPRVDVSGVNAPTQAWINLNSTGKPVMQFTWDTPVGAANQCGRVLFNEYHVENPVTGSGLGEKFPAECANTEMTPQEKLLEYSLFDLGNDGGPATMTPTTQDFGKQAVGFQSAPATFTIKNNSIFAVSVDSVATTGDYVVTTNSCGASVPSQGTCSLGVAFKPAALGQRDGSVKAVVSGTNLVSSLTGTGVPPLVLNTAALDFGSTDVTSTVTRVLTVTNNATGPIAVPPLAASSDFSTASSCGTLAAGASCNLNLSFTPTAAGPRTATLGLITPNPAYPGLAVQLTGNGVDFGVAMTPGSDTVVAGLEKAPVLITSPIAGFSNPVTLSCSTTAPAVTCSLATGVITPAAVTSTNVLIVTQSKYTLVGYGGFPMGWLMLAPLGAGLALFVTRRRSSSTLKWGLWMLIVAAGTTGLTGCSGKIPALNSSYTPPGNYVVTFTATDGILTRTTNYNLTVKAN